LLLTVDRGALTTDGASVDGALMTDDVSVDGALIADGALMTDGVLVVVCSILVFSGIVRIFFIDQKIKSIWSCFLVRRTYPKSENDT